MSPVVELTKKDDKFVLTSNSTFKNSAISFKLGEEFDEETLDGRKAKSVITQDGNKLLHTQKSDKIETTIVREFEPNQLKMVTCRVGLSGEIIAREKGVSNLGVNSVIEPFFFFSTLLSIVYRNHLIPKQVKV